MLKLNSDTDAQWRKFGDENPHYGVLTHERFLARNLDEAAEESFFASGSQHIAGLFEDIQRHFARPVRFTSALDYGCGAGRIAVPLAALADSVLGVDVSEGMLREARKASERRNAANVELVHVSDFEKSVSGKFEFVHTYIVLQHIPPGRGLRIIQRLVEVCAPGGIGCIHVVYGKSRRARLISFIKENVPLGPHILNVCRGRPWSAPYLQMYAYRLEDVYQLIRAAGIHSVVTKFTNHDENHGAMLMFQKPVV
jgi:2-polyprenyl-3-methyl-5-hydroxy-6-metoxy-1,4-benzoquinol methylase